MKRAPPRANIGAKQTGQAASFNPCRQPLYAQIRWAFLESFGYFLTCFEKLCTILEEIGADEDKPDGCSGNAELGSPGSRIAGSRGFAAETSRRIDPAASARAARDR